MARIDLNRRLQENTRGYEYWNKTCTVYTQPSQNGSVVDTSIDISKKIDDCVNSMGKLMREKDRLTLDIAEYNEKHKQ